MSEQRIGRKRSKGFFGRRKEAVCNRIAGRLFRVVNGAYRLIDRCGSDEFKSAFSELMEERMRKERLAEVYDEHKELIQDEVRRIDDARIACETRCRYYEDVLRRMHALYMSGDFEGVEALFAELGLNQSIKE